MKKNILILILLFQVLTVTSQQWIPDPNKKFALTYPIGSVGVSLLTVKDTLYVGGNFFKIDTVNAFGIARYYNGNWHPLKGGIYGLPFSLLYNNGNLYVGGDFNWADNKPGTQGLARWDGTDWYPIGSNSDCAGGGVLELYQNKIFVGGNIPAINSVTPVVTGNIAYFNDTNWINASNNLPVVSTLHKYNSELLGGCYPDGFIKYEGGTNWSWYPYNSSPGVFAYRMTNDTINDLLYLSGEFAYISYNPLVVSYGIAMYDGFEWHSMGTELIAAGPLKVYNGYLYTGIGTDTLNNGLQVNYIARWDWDSFSWHQMGTGLNQPPVAIEEFHDTLFVTGEFTIAGGDSAYSIARWYMSDTNCAFLRPTIHTLALQDTFYLGTGQVNVQFFNNNAYAQTWQWNFGDTGTDNIQNPTHTYTNDTAYTITVTVTEDGCTKTDTATIWVLNGNNLEEYTSENLNFKIFPNPTSGDFTIECTLPQNKTGKVKAFRTTGTQLGEHVLESGLNNFVMPASNWKDSVILVGLYIENKQVLVEKVVKK